MKSAWTRLFLMLTVSAAFVGASKTLHGQPRSLPQKSCSYPSPAQLDTVAQLKKPLLPDDVNDTCYVYFIQDIPSDSDQSRAWLRLERGSGVVPQLAGKSAFTQADGKDLLPKADCEAFQAEGYPAIWCENTSVYTLFVATPDMQYEVSATRWPYDPASARYVFTRIVKAFFLNKNPGPPYSKPLMPSVYAAKFAPKPVESPHKWNDLRNGLWKIDVNAHDSLLLGSGLSHWNVCIADGGASLPELITDDLDKCKIFQDQNTPSTANVEHIYYNCRDFLTGTSGTITLTHVDKEHYSGETEWTDQTQTGGRMGPVKKNESQQSSFMAAWIPDTDRTCQNPVTKAIFEGKPKPVATAADNTPGRQAQPGAPPNKTCIIHYQATVPNPAGSANSYTYQDRTRVGRGYECP